MFSPEKSNSHRFPALVIFRFIFSNLVYFFDLVSPFFNLVSVFWSRLYCPLKKQAPRTCLFWCFQIFFSLLSHVFSPEIFLVDLSQFSLSLFVSPVLSPDKTNASCFLALVVFQSYDFLIVACIFCTSLFLSLILQRVPWKMRLEILN